MITATPKKLNDEENLKAQLEGWTLMDTDDGIELQAIIDSELFDEDIDAHKYVAKRASEGSNLHCKVKDLLLKHNSKHHNIVFIKH